ncbi:hypothetical protein [uncultured Eubacterium sp.]|uniref:hypothetical protein n=1 Tax=uncultured Eubacterium sp. TaxID=165185 RepID=UPI0025FD941D|nr:hypothetical protein [uncultured Eubacterium sp.]
MTNANDFRRYSYQNDTSYMISGFNLSRTSAAPKHREEDFPEEQRTLKVHENDSVKTSKQIKSEQVMCAKRAFIFVLTAIFIVGFVGLTLYSFAVKNELTREISKVKVEISNAQSENISLQSELDTMISISMIDDYAVNKLHMTKMKSNQIQYMDVNQFKNNYMKEINQNKTLAEKQLSNK